MESSAPLVEWSVDGRVENVKLSPFSSLLAVEESGVWRVESGVLSTLRSQPFTFYSPRFTLLSPNSELSTFLLRSSISLHNPRSTLHFTLHFSLYFHLILSYLISSFHSVKKTASDADWMWMPKTDVPTAEPSAVPSFVPTDEPTYEPTDEPTPEPTDEPTPEPA